MRKIFTLFLSVLLVSAAFAQDNPRAVIKKTDVKPVIDGVFDDVWATVDSQVIARPYWNSTTQVTTPTLGDLGKTWWKALWDEDGYYLIVNVDDDNYFPNYVNGSGNPWDYDKPEIYYDVNYVLRDGLGPSSGGSGHYQDAPDMTLAKEGGAQQTSDGGRIYAFKVENPAYVAEYFVPWTWLKDKEGIGVDKTGEIGFDVMINDNDPSVMARMRAIWGADNSQGTGEAWVNMDESGIITLEGAEAGIPVESVAITGGSITSDNQTLQIEAVVLPQDAEVKDLKWTIAPAEGSMGRATISSKGVVTPILDGVMVVTASSTDGTFIDSEPVEVTISGQVPTVSELSYLKNGNFDVFDATTLAPGAPWSGGSTVVDGVLNINNPTAGANPWDWTVGQEVQIPASLKEEPFIFKARLWAAAERIFDVDFELISGDYNRFGDTPDPKSGDGKTQWRFNLTTEPTMYTIQITNFTRMDTRVQKFNLFAGMATPTVYVDSVSLVSVADMALIPTAIAQNSVQSFKVYPNPAVSVLNVDLSTTNTTVAIYNSVGIKMDETIVTGTHHMFDVSRYTKGLYFVKANNAVVKFVK
jgi:hypothetical protein